MSDKLNQAIVTIKSGDKQTGRRLLIEILKTEPHNENAWLWMTQVVSKKDEKIKCLERVLKINPDNEIAQKGMARLRPVGSPSLDDIEPQTKTPVIKRKKRERTESTIKRLEQTKQCPYCAETIKIEAKACRFCGRDLETGQPPMQPQAPVIIQAPPQRLWSPGIAALLSFIIPGAGQMYKGQVGTGILWLIFVIVGYAVFIVPGLILHVICVFNAVSGNPYTEGTVSKTNAVQKPNTSWRGPLIVAGVLIGGFILCIAFSLLPALLITPSGNNASPSNKVATATPQPTPTKKIVKPTPTVKPLGWTGDATEYAFHAFRIGKRGTYLGGVLLDDEGQIEVYLGHDQDIDNLELVADCYSFDKEGCGVAFVLDLREGDHFFEVTSDGSYTLVLERQ